MTDLEDLRRAIQANAQTRLELLRGLQRCEAEDAALQLQLADAIVAATAAFWAGRGSLLLGDGITDDTLLLVARRRTTRCWG